MKKHHLRNRIEENQQQQQHGQERQKGTKRPKEKPPSACAHPSKKAVVSLRKDRDRIARQDSPGRQGQISAAKKERSEKTGQQDFADSRPYLPPSSGRAIDK